MPLNFQMAFLSTLYLTLSILGRIMRAKPKLFTVKAQKEAKKLDNSAEVLLSYHAATLEQLEKEPTSSTPRERVL